MARNVPSCSKTLAKERQLEGSQAPSGRLRKSAKLILALSPIRNGKALDSQDYLDPQDIAFYRRQSKLLRRDRRPAR